MKKNKLEITTIPKKISTPLLYRITRTIILSLVIFSLLLITLYVVGNYQNFQDLSQKTILNVLMYTAILTLFLTVPVIVEDIIMLFVIKQKTGRIVSLVLMLLTILFCTFCLLYTGMIEIISVGF